MRFFPICMALIITLSLSGCGAGRNQESGSPADISQSPVVPQKTFGIDLAQDLGLENPQQIVCGQTCAWAITTRRDDMIYQYAYEAEGVARAEEIRWSQGEEESLVSIAERDGRLYASVWNRDNRTIAVREYIHDEWNTIMIAEGDSPEGYLVGSPLLVDSAGQAYLVSGNTVTCFGSEGKAVYAYELEGEPCFLRENSEGTVECMAARANRIALYELREGEAGEKWTLGISADIPWVIRSGEDDPLCLATKHQLLFIDRESGSLLACCDRLLLGVPSVMAGVYDAGKESLQLYGTDSVDGSSGSLRYSRLSYRDGAEQRIELVYGTRGSMGIPADINAAIMTFNQENENYYITIRNYYSETEPGYMSEQRFHADVVAGKGPDIIDMSYSPYYDSYAGNGYLVDLFPYLEESPYRDDIIWNVLNAYEINGGVYVLVPEFWCEGMVIHPDYVDMAEEWNTETFLRFLEKNQWEKNVFDIWQGDPLAFLKIMLASRQEEFWNREQGTASFETQEFVDMLALCREYAQQDWPDTDTLGWTHEDRKWNNLFYPYTITAFTSISYLSDVDVYGREYPIHGYPTLSGQVYQITSPDCCGIYSGSQHKEGAWEFLETLLEEQTQRYRPLVNPGLPVRRSVLEERLAEEKGYTVSVNGETLSLSEEELQIQRDIIYGGTFVRGYIDNDIWVVVEEETSAYFSGAKSAQDVAHIIQSRVGLILAE